MPSKIDLRHKQIGGKHRAMSRYYMLLHRVNTETDKNNCYRGIEVRVTKEDFINWFMERDFEGCSVDRIDSTGHYELSNMQVIPLALNIGKDKIKAKDGKCVCFACQQEKPLEEFVRDSRRQITGRTTICKVCESKRPSRRRKGKQ